MAETKRRRRARRLGWALLLLLLLLLIGPFLIPVRPQEGLAEPRDLADPDSRFVTLPLEGTEGVELHYKEAGSGAPTYVLIHGFTYNLYSWERVFDFFAARGRVIAYDQAPFGLSQRLVSAEWAEVNPYAPESRLERLIALLDALGVEEAILVGNSAGGALATQAALEYPERVSGLILVAPAIGSGGAPAFVRPLLRLPQIQHLGPLFARAAAEGEIFNRTGYADPQKLTAAAREKSNIYTQINRWDVAFWEYNVAAAASFDLEGRLEDVSQPVLLIHGQGDEVVDPAESRALAESFPDAELVLLPACGHFPQDECPEAFREAVSAWAAPENGAPP
jgi:pimeloyl-ACP methyl ester carboxylesterase